MATPTPRHFACENGHPVREGSTLCAACGAQVTSRVVEGPRSTPSARQQAQSRPHAQPSDATTAATDAPPDPIAVARRRTIVASAVGGVVALAGGVLAFGLAGSSNEGGPGGPGGSGLRTACGGLANVEVEIGDVLSQAPAVVCFTVAAETTLTVGATSASGRDLTLSIQDARGDSWASADDTIGTDPEVTTTFLPGTYVVSVAEYGGGAAGVYDFYVRASSGPAVDPSLPSEDACGGADAPLLVVRGPSTMPVVDGSYACVEIVDPAFVKIGLVGDPSGVPDLNLAIHAYANGRPVFLRSVDDTIGVDPEVNLALDPGLYLLEVWAVDGSPVGTYTVYADDTRTLERTGAVSAPFAGLTAADCSSGAYPTVAIDDAAPLPDGVTVACVAIPDVRRVAIEARSETGQDLTLEVIGFAEDGTPLQYANVDDDLWAVNIEDYDPRIDLVLPPGTYALGVAEFWGATPTGVVVSVEDLDR